MGISNMYTCKNSGTMVDIWLLFEVKCLFFIIQSLSMKYLKETFSNLQKNVDNPFQNFPKSTNDPQESFEKCMFL